MKLETQRHTTSVLWVKVPLDIGFTASAFDAAIDDVGSLRDSIVISGDTLPEIIDELERDLDMEVERGDPRGVDQIHKFLSAVVELQPTPDEYIFHK